MMFIISIGISTLKMVGQYYCSYFLLVLLGYVDLMDLMDVRTFACKYLRLKKNVALRYLDIMDFKEVRKKAFTSGVDCIP